MGLAWLWALPLNGFLGVGAYWAARHGFRQPAGLTRGLAAAILAWTWVTLGMEALGTSGLLAPLPLLIWSTAGLAIGALLRAIDRREVSDGPSGPSDVGWDGRATLAVGLVVWGATLLGVQSLLFPVKVVSDGPIYHLYFAARWWKAGRVFLVAAPFGENAATYFPAVGDLWFTWLVTSWGGDRLARVGQAPFFLAAGLAAFALARRLGAGAPASVVASAWFLTLTPLLSFTFEPNVDMIFVAGYLLAALFFLRDALGDGGMGTLALGGLAAGGALGTKPTGVVFVPVLLGLAALAVLLREGSNRRRVRDLAVVLLAPLVMAGYWYARTALLTGNPLYPLQVSALGRVWLAGWYGPEVMRRSAYAIPVGDWRALADILLMVFDPRLAPVWVAALAGAWAWGWLRDPLEGWVWGCSALAVLNVALYWLVIPYRTQQRFMLHAAGLAVVPLARLFDRRRWAGWAAVGLLGAHLLVPQEWPFAPRASPWDFSPKIPGRIPPLISYAILADPMMAGIAPREDVARAQVELPILGLAALMVAWAWGRVGRPHAWRRGIGAVAASLALLGLAAALLVPRDADARRLFYPLFRPYLAGWRQLELRAGPSGTRIAYAGTNLPYFLLGYGWRNEVRYVNVDRHRDWLLHDYHREARARGRGDWPDPRPGWDRVQPDYDAWLANLRAERIQVLVVARVNRLEGSHNVADPTGFPIERRWAESHPEAFQPLYGVAEDDPEMRIYRVRRPASREFSENRDPSTTDRDARSHESPRRLRMNDEARAEPFGPAR